MKVIDVKIYQEGGIWKTERMRPVVELGEWEKKHAPEGDKHQIKDGVIPNAKEFLNKIEHPPSLTFVIFAKGTRNVVKYVGYDVAIA